MEVKTINVSTIVLQVPIKSRSECTKVAVQGFIFMPIKNTAVIVQ